MTLGPRLVLLLLFAAAPAAFGREIRLPLNVDPTVIREALLRDAFTAPGHRALLWGEPDTCSFFYLSDPKVETLVSRVRVIAHGEARLGTELGGGCFSPISWGGYVEVMEQPRIEGWRLRFDVVDSNLYDEKMEKSLLVGQLWDRIKESLQPSFAAVSVDLGQPFQELREFLPLIASPAHLAEAERALDSLHLLTATALPRGVVIEAAMDVGEPPAAAAAAPEAPLTEAEIDAFSERLNQWDAFVTFVVKELGRRTLSQKTRDSLLETLLDARYQLLAALRKPAARKRDPLRALFVKSWERLRPVADEVARGLPGAEALRVLTFVAAGDALSLLDQAGPAFGIEISADGLRRMARMIQPAGGEDPLDYSAEVDPALRHFMGFGPPVEELKAPPEETPAAAATAAPEASPEPESTPVSPSTPAAEATAPGAEATTVPSPAAPETPATGANPAPPVEAAPDPQAPAEAPAFPSPQSLLRWLLPAEASAAPPPAPKRIVADHSKDWKGWVVQKREDVPPYLRRVGKVLHDVSSQLVAREKLTGTRADFYRKLVPATAWQESCWRQFVPRAGKVSYIASKQGAVGLMQLNERVWRGFYESDKLRWSLTYNAQAGAEVLHHYVGLVDAVRPEITRANMKETGKAVYAAYNGGPSQLRRYLDAKSRDAGARRVIEKLFAPKFDAAGDGMESKVAVCLIGGG